MPEHSFHKQIFFITFSIKKLKIYFHGCVWQSSEQGKLYRNISDSIISVGKHIVQLIGGLIKIKVWATFAAHVGDKHLIAVIG